MSDCSICGRDHNDLSPAEVRAYEKVAHDAAVVVDGPGIYTAGTSPFALVLTPPSPGHPSGRPGSSETWGWYITRWEWSPTGWWWPGVGVAGHGYPTAARAERDGRQALWNYLARLARSNRDIAARIAAEREAS